MSDVNLSQLIVREMDRQRKSYAGLEAQALAAGIKITASYLCILVRKPLAGLRPNTIKGVAAALALDEDQVASAAMTSWGYHLQRTCVDGNTCAVLSNRSLTPEQVDEVLTEADRHIKEIKAGAVRASRPRKRVTNARIPGQSRRYPGRDEQ